jgi:hypothetical protein
MFEYEFKANRTVNPFDIHGLNVALGTTCSYQKDDKIVIVRTESVLECATIKTSRNLFTLIGTMAMTVQPSTVFAVTMVKQIHSRINNGQTDVISSYGNNTSFLIKHFESLGINELQVLSITPLDLFGCQEKSFYIGGAFSMVFTANIAPDIYKALLMNGIGQKKSYGFGAIRPIK